MQRAGGISGDDDARGPTAEAAGEYNLSPNPASWSVPRARSLVSLSQLSTCSLISFAFTVSNLFSKRRAKILDDHLLTD